MIWKDTANLILNNDVIKFSMSKIRFLPLIFGVYVVFKLLNFSNNVYAEIFLVKTDLSYCSIWNTLKQDIRSLDKQQCSICCIFPAADSHVPTC